MLSNHHTLTGIPLDENLWDSLSRLYHPRAYDSIRSKSYLSDVNNGFVIRRLYRVFGPRGLGWGLNYDRQDLNIREYQTKDGKPRFEASVVKAIFWYLVVMPNGDERRFTITVASSSDNDGIGDAIKGALTGCIKKAVSYIGHQNALYRGDLSHDNVGSVIERRGYEDSLGGLGLPTPPQDGPEQDSEDTDNTNERVREDIGAEKEGPVERPMDPQEVKELLIQRAMQYDQQSRTATDPQRRALPGWLSQCFPNDSNSRQRHATTEWIFGVSSTKDLTGPQVLALIDWLDPEDNTVNPHSIAEGQRMWREAQKAQGQGEMEL